jgi:NADPH:quinone reductase-like Zn-dependent oxidoreductase
VRVGAAGVGPWDGWVRAGSSALPHPLPLTPGADFSGTVEAVGAAVRGLAAGDAVFGVANAGFTGAHARSFAVLAPGGILVPAASEPDAGQAARRGVRARFFLVDVTTERLTRIAELLDAGGLRTRVGAVLPLADARAAHEMLEGQRARPRGRIVLRIGDGPER